jgi:hypothetical protein
MIKKICKICKKRFNVSEYRSETAKFCSIDCRNKEYIGKSYSIKTQFKKGQIAPMKGKKRNDIIGNNNPSKKIETRRKIADAKRGNKSHFWKGGITEKNRLIKNSFEYKLWREAIFERDDYTCLICGVRGNKLNAHHILSFSKFPELRLALNNGITLCESCHKKTDNYGNKKIIYPNGDVGIEEIK